MIARHSRPAGGTVLVLGLIAAAGIACTARLSGKQEGVPVVKSVDLPRYMGPWFVVGAIGLGLEKGAHNAVETYTLNPDGTIATVFQFRKDDFQGALETMPTKAWVQAGTGNAEWRVRTFWPLKQQYVISYLEPDYSVAIVARDARDYVWILAREPRMDDRRFSEYRRKIEAMGYEMSEFSRYPQNGSRPDAATPDRG